MARRRRRGPLPKPSSGWGQIAPPECRLVLAGAVAFGTGMVDETAAPQAMGAGPDLRHHPTCPTL